MSASLVGSEMCIRDSPTPGCRRRGEDFGRGASQGTRGRQGKKTAERPVSYTHLTLPTICSV
eukprot:13070252-Alexandrium_andersonii.AAC.1